MLRERAGQLRALSNSYIAERSLDLEDLEKRLLRHLVGEPTGSSLSPAIVAGLHPSRTSHRRTRLASLGSRSFIVRPSRPKLAARPATAILAGAARDSGGHRPRPVPVRDRAGAGEKREREREREKRAFIVDGNDEGLIYIDPDEATIGRFHRAIQAEEQHRASQLISRQVVDDICTTADGARVIVLGTSSSRKRRSTARSRGPRSWALPHGVHSTGAPQGAVRGGAFHGVQASPARSATRRS